MHFADNLRAIRKERRLSQEDLAELLHVSRQAVSKWEQGVGYPEMETVIALAGALSVSLDALLTGETTKAESHAPSVAPTGKIMIKTHDGKQIVTCHTVQATQMLLSAANEPKHILSGMHGTSFFGSASTILGWYTNEDAIQKEINAIFAAMERGCASYVLQYNVKVKVARFQCQVG